MKFVAILVLLVGAVICKPADEAYYEDESYGDYRDDKAHEENSMAVEGDSETVLYPQNTSDDEHTAEVSTEYALAELETEMNDTSEMTQGETPEEQMDMKEDDPQEVVPEEATEEEENSQTDSQGKDLTEGQTEEAVTNPATEDGVILEDGELETTTVAFFNETEPEVIIKEFHGEDGLLMVLKEIIHPDGTVENVAS